MLACLNTIFFICSRIAGIAAAVDTMVVEHIAVVVGNLTAAEHTAAAWAVAWVIAWVVASLAAVAAERTFATVATERTFAAVDRLAATLAVAS